MIKVIKNRLIPKYNLTRLLKTVGGGGVVAQRGGDPPRYVTIGGALVTFKHLSHSYAGKLPHREIFQFVGNSLDRNMIYILQLEQAASSADKVKEWKGECEFMIKPA